MAKVAGTESCMKDTQGTKLANGKITNSIYSFYSYVYVISGEENKYPSSRPAVVCTYNPWVQKYVILSTVVHWKGGANEELHFISVKDTHCTLVSTNHDRFIVEQRFFLQEDE